MPTPAFILFPADATWRLHTPAGVDELPFDPDATPRDLATAIAARLHDRGYQGQGLLLALPSNWCLAASISTEGLPRHDHAAMTFRLEEKLPLPAESFTADFVESGDRALGVCVPNDRILPLVTALETAGVVVQSVSPAAMLAAASLSFDDGDHTLLWGERDRVNVIALSAGRPVHWALIEPTPEAISLHLATAPLDPAEIHALDVPPHLVDAPHTSPDPISDAVARTAPDVLSGRVSPWFELRRGVLAIDDPLRVVRRSVNAALVAAIAFCVVLSAVFLYRGWRYDGLARTYESQSAAEFRRQFPTWPVPTSVRAVVESERRRLTLAGGSALPAEAQSSALRLLRDILSKLPPDAPIALDRMAFHDTLVELEGRARANPDVDLLVSAAKSAGLDVPPPQLRKTADNTWTFFLRATRPVSPSPAPGAAAGGLDEP